MYVCIYLNFAFNKLLVQLDGGSPTFSLNFSTNRLYVYMYIK